MITKSEVLQTSRIVGMRQLLSGLSQNIHINIRCVWRNIQSVCLSVALWFLRKSPKDFNQISLAVLATWSEESDEVSGSAGEAGRVLSGLQTLVLKSQLHSRFHSQLNSWEGLLFLRYLHLQPRQLFQATMKKFYFNRYITYRWIQCFNNKKKYIFI